LHFSSPNLKDIVEDNNHIVMVVVLIHNPKMAKMVMEVEEDLNPGNLDEDSEDMLGDFEENEEEKEKD